jgi:hypothetical protein
MSTTMRTGRRLKVGVLVDLALTRAAGGHVKCWQRIAEAAVGCADRLDLTVHFSGSPPRRIELSPSVRYVLLPPVLSTTRLVREVPDHTDLAPWHPRLARALADYDVIHTTDAFFCYARTATRFARRRGIPVVSSRCRQLGVSPEAGAGGGARRSPRRPAQATRSRIRARV